MLRRALTAIITIAVLLVTPMATLPASAAATTHVYAGQSLQNAVNAAGDGDVIVVHGGNYSGISISGRNWTTPITVVGAPNEHAVVASFWMLNTNGVIMRSLDIPGSIQARFSSHLEVSDSHVGQGVKVRDGATGIRVLRNRIDGGDRGVWIYNDASTTRNSNVVISGNDIFGQTGDNIQVGAADGLLIEDNTLHDIADNVDHNDGIQLMGSEGATIRRNRIWAQDEAIILKAEPYLGAGNRVANVRVENNIVTNERGAGIIVAGTNDVDIVNNTGAGNIHADVHIEASNPGLRIWNNVVKQIWKGGSIAPSLENHNCGADIFQNGPNDVIATPQLNASYQLAANSPCLTAATATNAPGDDLGKQLRASAVIPGAWQTTSGAVLPTPGTTTPSGGSSNVLPASQRPQGYWIARNDGRVDAFGGAPSIGGGALRLNSPIVGMARTPAGQGYWLVGGDGGIFSYGDAPFLGSTGNIVLNKPIVGMAAAPIGVGYWFVASDGGVFSYGDARFFGSMGGKPLNRPIVGMTPTPTGNGYWLVAADGGIFAFGDAPFFGSTGNIKLNKPIVGMASAPDGRGYWFVASDGGVFSYGSSKFFGSTGGTNLSQPVTGFSPTPSGAGYWMVAADGGIFAFGDAGFQGSGASSGGAPAITMLTPSQ